MQRGVIKRLGDQTVDVQLAGSAATLPGVLLSGQIDRSALAVGAAVLVDLVDERAVVLHTLAGEQQASLAEQPFVGASSAVTNNALLSDGSVPLLGNLVVAPGVLIDGYDISVLGQTIDNLQAADSVARTGHTVLTHASHLVATLGPDDTEVLVRHGIFRDKETLMVSNTMGEVETMRVVGNGVATVDDRGALCYRYTVTRRTGTNPPGIVTGWAAATLVNGLTHKGFISVDARETSVAAPNLRFVMHTDIDAGATEQIFRMGNLYGILGNDQTDFGFATGRLNTGDRYFSYNYSRNLLALRGADISVKDDAGVEVFRVWGIAEGDHDTGNTRIGKASGGHIETREDRVSFYSGSQEVMYLSPAGTRFRNMVWSGTQPGPQIGIGEENGQGLIAARNAAGVGQFVVRTGDENVHVHMGNPVTEGGYAQFADGEFTTDGVIRARAFELLGGGTINPGSTLTNAGKFTAGTGNNVAVIDGEDAAWRIYAGHATPASAPFRVNQAGEVWLDNAHVAGVIQVGGTAGGWTIAADYLVKDTGVNSTSAGLAPLDYPFYAGATYANRAAAPFRVTPAGALTASNADITGTINATAGVFGGWTLNSTYLAKDTGIGATSAGLAPNDYPFYAGATYANRANAPFRVTNAGALTASNADITGTINATAGSFTGSVFVGAAAPRIHIDGANKRIESTNFASGTSGFRIEGATGNAEFNNVTVRGAIMATVLQYGYVQATSGSIWVTKAAGKLRTTFTAPSSGSATLDIEDPAGMSHASAGALWSINDVVRIKEPLSGDWWATITNKTDMATHWRLTAATQSGSGVFAAGAAALNYGQTGEGVVRITADAANNPYISIATHSGSPWSSLTERARLGNLTGISGASGYGLWTDNGFFTGTVNANAGSIAGWTIASGHLYAGSSTNRAGMQPASYPFYAGSETPASAPFRVTPAGVLTASSATITGTITANAGSIAGWTIASGHLYAGSAANRAGLQPASYPFYAGSETPASAPFRVTPAGALTASDATVSGTITANAGSIAGWTIASGHLYAGSGVNRTGLQPATYPFYAGSETPSAAPFRVTQSGSLIASNATITGTINAAAGNITGSLYVGASGNRLHLDGANKRFESTNFASGTAGFRIEGETGNAEFNNVTVRGAIMAAVLQYGYVQATSGSIWVTKAAGKTTGAFNAPGVGSTASLNIEDPAGIDHSVAGTLWSTGDVVRLKEPLVGDFWGTVTAKTDMTAYWRLTVQGQSGSGYFPAGATVLNYGQSGNGVVRITADASNNPYISVATHSGSPWASLTERARLGNLTGVSGASGYGLWTDNGYFTGTVNANAGSIGGWTIVSGHLYAGSGASRAGMQPASYPFYAGSETPASAPFRVTPAGALTATSGAVGGWTLGLSSLTGGNATLHSSGYLSLGTNNDIARLDAADTTYRLWIGNATSSLSPFRVTKAGALTASDATITGTINATAGNITGSLYVGAASPRIHIDGANKRIESTNFVSGTSGFRIEGATGNAEFNNVTVRGAITSAVFTYNQIQATAGEIIVAKSAGKLASSLALGMGTRAIYVEDPPGISHAAAGGLWAANDIVRVKDLAIGDVWFKITSVVDNTSNWVLFAAYQSGTYVGTMPAGTTIVNYGSSGQGLVRISATDGYAPFVSIATHAGSPWTALTEKARLGNLSGISGASGYGLWTDNGYFTGTVNASAGTIAGWSIAATKLYWEDPANYQGIGMATYNDAGGYAFWAGDHRPAYAEFRVSKSGALWATTATITGAITADTLTANSAGSIAGWTIASGHLYAGAGASRAGMQPASYPFYAGSDTPASAPFRVTPAGALTASNATVTGTITANAGSMAGWTIASGHLYAGSGASRAGLQPASYPFYAGSETPASAPFRVTPAGALTATSGVIGGWTLSGTKLSSSLIQLDAANNKIQIGSTYFHQFDIGIVELAGDFRVTGALAADVGFGCTGFSAYGSSFWHTGNLLGFYGATPVTRPAAYTFSNGVTDRTINCDSTTVAELADVVYTMWSDLKNLGLLR